MAFLWGWTLQLSTQEYLGIGLQRSWNWITPAAQCVLMLYAEEILYYSSLNWIFFFSPSTYFSRNVSWKRIFGPTTNLVGSTTYMLLKTFKKVCEVPKRLLLKYFLSIWNLIHTIPLFSNKEFMLDEMFEWNTSKFAIFLEYENPRIFSFFNSCNFIFFFP